VNVYYIYATHEVKWRLWNEGETMPPCRRYT